MTNIREWLKEIRKERGMTQQQVADLVGISQNYYCYIENGDRCEQNKNDTEKRIAKVLEFDWIKFFEEERCEPSK